MKVELLTEMKPCSGGLNGYLLFSVDAGRQQKRIRRYFSLGPMLEAASLSLRSVELVSLPCKFMCLLHQSAKVSLIIWKYSRGNWNWTCLHALKVVKPEIRIHKSGKKEKLGKWTQKV